MPEGPIPPELLPGDGRARRALAVVAGNAALAVAYFGVARLSLYAATEHRVVSSIWPPAGIALFALLRFGLRYAPGVALGAFALNAASGVTPWGAAAIAIGDMLEGAVGAHVVGRLLGQRRSLTRVRDVVALTAVGGGLATMIAATVGVGTLLATAGTTWASAPSLWLVWWTGDAVGILVLTPFLLAWTSPDHPPPAVRWRWAEAGALFLALALVTDYVFSNAGVLVFAVYPLALVISWRFGTRAAATASLAVALIATFRTLSGEGPFVSFTPTANLFALQFFLSLLAVKNLAFAAARTEALYSESRLAASEGRYRMLAQKLPDGCVALFDRDMRVLLAEGPAIAALGVARHDVEGRRLADLFDEERTRALTGRLRPVLDGAETEFEFSLRDRLYLVRVVPTDDPDFGRCGMAMALDVTARAQAQREVVESREQLERLSRLLLTAQEDERRRVAREVHDELGQALTAVKIGIAQSLARAQRRNSLETERRARNAADLLDKAIEAVQRIVLRLRPGVLDSLGPLAALEHEVQQFREQSGLDVTLTLPPEPLDVDGEQSTAMYRTVQEALTNVMRHAQARSVAVSLRVTSREFLLSVTDDGVGISEEQLRKPRSMGLLGMRERAAACGGTVSVTHAEPAGTRVTLRIPRRVPAAGLAS